MESFYHHAVATNFSHERRSIDLNFGIVAGITHLNCESWSGRRVAEVECVLNGLLRHNTVAEIAVNDFCRLEITHNGVLRLDCRHIEHTIRYLPTLQCDTQVKCTIFGLLNVSPLLPVPGCLKLDGFGLLDAFGKFVFSVIFGLEVIDFYITFAKDKRQEFFRSVEVFVVALAEVFNCAACGIADAVTVEFCGNAVIAGAVIERGERALLVFDSYTVVDVAPAIISRVAEFAISERQECDSGVEFVCQNSARL